MAETFVKRKDQITETAQNLFRERGYAATSMRDLAKAVGIEPASLYSHIKSKEELLSSICHRIADEFLEGMLQTQDKPPVEQFRLVMKLHIQVIARHLDATAVFFNEWRHLSGDDLASFMQKRQQYEEYFRQIIRQGIAEGDFVTKDVNFSVRIIFSAMNGMHDWYHVDGKLSTNEITNRICDLLLSGLYKDIDSSSL